jgi:hypothetical protein
MNDLDLNVNFDSSGTLESNAAVDFSGFEDSQVLSTRLQKQLHLILKSEVRYLSYANDNETENFSWKKIYSAEEDGWEAFNFHQKAQTYKNSVLIIKAKSGAIFGSFSDISWNGPKTERVFASQRCFLFVALGGDDKKSEIMRLSVAPSKSSQAVTHSAWTLAQHGAFDLVRDLTLTRTFTLSPNVKLYSYPNTNPRCCKIAQI